MSGSLLVGELANFVFTLQPTQNIYKKKAFMQTLVLERDYTPSILKCQKSYFFHGVLFICAYTIQIWLLILSIKSAATQGIIQTAEHVRPGLLGFRACTDTAEVA